MDPRSPTTAADTNAALATPKTRSRPPLPSKRASDAATKEVYASLSDALSDLASNYDALQGQATEIALLGKELGTDQDVKDFRQQINDQDFRHKESMEEIQNIIDQILQDEADDMRKQVNQEIADQIDELVKDQVAQCLKDHLPDDLRFNLAENKREYEDLQIALHNSESRRLNGTLRANKPDDILYTILMFNGSVSARFPKDLRSLFDLDSDTLKALMADYDVNGVGNIRDTNLNKFMQFCGVRYQLVVKSDIHKTNNIIHVV